MILNRKSLLEYPVNADVPILGPILSLLNIDYFPDDVIGNIATLSVQIFARIKFRKFWLKLRILVIVKSLGNTYSRKLVLQHFGTCCTVIMNNLVKFVTIYVTTIQCFQQKRQR